MHKIVAAFFLSADLSIYTTVDLAVSIRFVFIESAVAYVKL